MNKSIISFFSFALFFAFASVSLISCSDDDDDDKFESIITYDSESYAINGGYLMDWGEHENIEGIYNLDLRLYTEGVSFNESDGRTGEGKILYAELWSSSEELVSGTYTYSTYDDVAANRFTLLSIYDNGDEEDSEIFFTSGTITVNKSGNNYTITVTGKDSDDKTISASFKGALNVYEPQ